MACEPGEERFAGWLACLVGNVGYGGAVAVTNVGPVRVGSIDGCAPGYRRIGDPATMVIIRGNTVAIIMRRR